MTHGEAVSEVFWRALKELPKKEREGVVIRMLKDKEVMGELIEMIVEQHLKEPSGSLYERLVESGKSRGD